MYSLVSGLTCAHVILKYGEVVCIYTSVLEWLFICCSLDTVQLVGTCAGTYILISVIVHVSFMYVRMYMNQWRSPVSHLCEYSIAWLSHTHGKISVQMDKHRKEVYYVSLRVHICGFRTKYECVCMSC